jgi:hypothetical protein
VRYGRNGGIDPLELDRMLDSGSSALRRVRVAAMWPARVAGTLARPVAVFGMSAWRR